MSNGKRRASTVTMHRDASRTGPHPETRENRHRGANKLYGVRAEYGWETDTVRLGGRLVQTQTLVGRNDVAHWYAPFVHDELPNKLAALRGAEAGDVLSFGETYGELGFQWLLNVDELNRRSEGDVALLFPGDPLPWIQAHATGVAFCLETTAALQEGARDASLRALANSYDGQIYGEAGEIAQFRFVWQDRKSRQERKVSDVVRGWRRRLINDNIRGISRYLSTDENGQERSYFGYSAVIEVVYWQLANAVDGGTVKRCEAEGCSGFFIQTDPRQRFCPKRWRQRESACATRQRQRKQER